MIASVSAVPWKYSIFYSTKEPSISKDEKPKKGSSYTHGIPLAIFLLMGSAFGIKKYSKQSDSMEKQPTNQSDAKTHELLILKQNGASKSDLDSINANRGRLLDGMPETTQTFNNTVTGGEQNLQQGNHNVQNINYHGLSYDVLMQHEARIKTEMKYEHGKVLEHKQAELGVVQKQIEKVKKNYE